MKKIFISLMACVVLCSCQNDRKFTVEGRINKASGETVVLEHNGILRSTPLDSARIGRDGSYRLRASRPAYPDFYRLRLKGKTITFAVDSTETVTIDVATPDSFATAYTVAGSPASEQIKTLRLSVIGIQHKLNLLDSGDDTAEVEADIERHKELARSVILGNPRSPAAYFAVHQQVNGRYIFSPYVSEDYPYWASVATAYHTFMPQYERSKNVYNLMLEVLAEQRKAQQSASIRELMQSDMASGYIDIALPDREGREVRLSDSEGKVVLIDFSSYESTESIDYTFALRDLYGKYASRGFEIYQVSLDRNKLLWEISTENLPWICVRDADGPANRYARLYNVTALPTTFLMDKAGNIVSRSLAFNELDKEIGRLLKK